MLERAHSDRVNSLYTGAFAALRLQTAALQMSAADAAHARELGRSALRASGSLCAGLYRALQPPPEDGWAAAADAKAQAKTADLESQRQLQNSYNIREQQRVRAALRVLARAPLLPPRPTTAPPPPPATPPRARPPRPPPAARPH